MKFAKISILLTLPLLALVPAGLAQDQPTSGEASSAGFKAKLYAPGVISKPDRHEFGSVISHDGRVLYFGVDTGNQRHELWRSIRGEDGRWQEPKVFLSHPEYRYFDPFIHPTKDQLYFLSNRPHPSKAANPEDSDIWFIEREAGQWSEPRWLGPPVNTAAKEFFVSFSDDGTIYFSSNVAAAGTESPSNFDIYSAEPAAQGFKAPRRLGTGVNTGAYEADVFVAPDGSYVIFATTRRSGFGRGDLFVSFRGENGRFQRAANLGEAVNTEGHELCPFVTRDGSTLLFTSRQDIYSIDASVLDAFRPQSSRRP